MVIENNPKLLERSIISEKIKGLQRISLFYEEILSLHKISKVTNSNTFNLLNKVT